MPIAFVADRGSAGITTVGTSTALAITSPTAITRWNTLLLAVASDNSGTDGAAPTLGITDPRGNTWVSRGTALRDPGLVDEGVAVYVFSALVATAYQAGDTLTLTASPSTGRAAWLLREFSGISANTTAPVAAASTSNASSSPSAAVDPGAAGRLVFGALGQESNVNPNADTDTVNGSWSTLTTAVSDSANWSTSVHLSVQHKIVTAAGTQTWNPTLTATYDWALVLAVIAAAGDLAATASYDNTIGRVRLTVSGYPAGTTEIRVTRFDNTTLTNGVTVRGTPVTGINAAVDTTRTIDDYEFTPGAVNTYRVTAYDSTGATRGSVDATITPAPSGVWLKNAARPYLNRAVTVHQYSEITRPARGGVLDVLGRRDPVAVTDVRGSRRFDLILRADTADEVAAIELALSFGDPVYLQPPAGSAVPGPLWAFVGDVTTDKGGEHQLPMRFLTLPLTEVETPDPGIVGAGITWAGVTGAYATWSAVTAAKATWLALMETISNPADEVVG